MWDKSTSRILNVFEADQNVVNVIEENPRFKVLAVSGIDHSIKVKAGILSFEMYMNQVYARLSDILIF